MVPTYTIEAIVVTETMKKLIRYPSSRAAFWAGFADGLSSARYVFAPSKVEIAVSRNPVRSDIRARERVARYLRNSAKELAVCAGE